MVTTATTIKTQPINQNKDWDNQLQKNDRFACIKDATPANDVELDQVSKLVMEVVRDGRYVNHFTKNAVEVANKLGIDISDQLVQELKNENALELIAKVKKQFVAESAEPMMGAGLVIVIGVVFLIMCETANSIEAEVYDPAGASKI
jgi:hypothetical protein